ncbi:MAG: NACHT domain-containing protein, partial [Armatimonadetes bacterium]|nr:NACHT domain-containing protein [Armatimonadota bacterium]
EADEYLALHRMCGALEIAARFLTVAALTEVWQRRVSPEDGFPEALVKQLLQHLERPRLGSWRVLLEAAVAALPGKKQKECTVQGLPEYVRRFGEALGGSGADPLQKLLPMRNVLAHGGRLSEEKIQEFLVAHTERFEALMAGLEFLSEEAGVALVASPAEGPARLLRGLPPEYPAFNRSSLPEDFRQAGPDRMLLVTPNGVLDLCPLHAFGEVMQVEKDQLVGQGEEAIQLYARSDAAAGVDYTALGSRASSSRGKPDWETRFAEVFRLEAWRSRFEVESALARYTFSRRMDDLLRLFVGRDEQVAAAAEMIDATESGVLWLAGKPGMGKSAFMAKLVRDVFQPRDDVVCIPYFFQASEGDLCRVSAFAEAALLRLAQTTGQDAKIEDDPEKRLDQFRAAIAEAANGARRIAFFLDGLDEISDPKLLDLIFECGHPGIVWVCAGRDEPHLVEHFGRDRCRWLFEQADGLLPPLNADNVRAFLIEELGHRLPQFFERDRQSDGAWRNEYVEEVIRRSDGLPLYLRLLEQDLRNDPNAFAPGTEERLPRGLEEYYDRIVEEMGDDLSATIPAITTLLALAHEPLPFETLAALLSDHELVGQADGRELLQDALRHSSVMLRRAPTATEALGYGLYHASFQQHVRTSDRVRRSRHAAHERLCRLATNWRDHEAGSPPRDYALRFGPRTLIDAERWDDLSALLTDLEFIEAKCEAGMTYELVADYNAALVVPSRSPVTGHLSPAVEPFARFVRANAHIFAQGLEWVIQRAHNSAESGPVAEAAQHLIEASAHHNQPWLRHLHRRPDTPSACLQVLQGHASGVSAVALTPDGQRAVTGSWDNTVRVWDLNTGTCLRTLQGHTSGVLAVALTPDGQRAVTGSYDNTVRVWDLGSGVEVACFAAEGWVWACAVGPGGLVAAGDRCGNVYFLRLENAEFGPPILTAWRAAEGELVAFGCVHCREWQKVAEEALGTELACPACGEKVKLNPFVIEADWRPVAEAWKREEPRA